MDAQVEMPHVKIITCPCCGQDVEGAKFLADPETNTITNGDKTVRFTKQHFRLARYLIDRFPRMASKEDIYDNVFQHLNGDGPELKIVDVIICKIRPPLADIGLVIETIWGKGYKIVEADPSMGEAIKEASVRLRGTGAAHRWRPEYDGQLLDLMKRGFTVSHIASVMKLPYMTIERHMKKLQPRLERSQSTIG